MKEQKKKIYEPPFTRRTQVESESGFCVPASVVQRPENNDDVKSVGHEVGGEFDFGVNGVNKAEWE